MSANNKKNIYPLKTVILYVMVNYLKRYNSMRYFVHIPRECCPDAESAKQTIPCTYVYVAREDKQ